MFVYILNRIEDNFDKGDLVDITFRNCSLFMTGIRNPLPMSPNLCSHKKWLTLLVRSNSCLILGFPIMTCW